MSLCVKMKEDFDEKKVEKLIELVDWITDEHFAKKSFLCQVGWCAHQLFQKRILNYKKGEELMKRVYLVEFFCFAKKPESSLICNYNYCNFFFFFMLLMCIFA